MQLSDKKAGPLSIRSVHHCKKPVFLQLAAHSATSSGVGGSAFAMVGDSLAAISVAKPMSALSLSCPIRF